MTWLAHGFTNKDVEVPRASGSWICFKGGVEKARMFMGFTVLEEPGEGGGKGGGGVFRVSAPFEMPTRQNRGDDTRALRLHVSAGSSAPRPVCTSRVLAGG